MSTDSRFDVLLAFLKKVPAVDPRMNAGFHESGLWWAKIKIDIKHPLAWRVVQEFGHILNWISLTEPLASVFKPVSPPVYLNGGPETYLQWLIESTDVAFTPDICAEWLEGRLPRPVGELVRWELEQDEEEA